MSTVQVSSLIDFLVITDQSNSLISAINTMASVIGSVQREPYIIYIEVTEYLGKNAAIDEHYISTCDLLSAIAPAGFYSLSYHQVSEKHKVWPRDRPGTGYAPSALAMVDGFYGGCTPFDALLASGLDCLYNKSCLEQLSYYFPGLHQV